MKVDHASLQLGCVIEGKCGATDMLALVYTHTTACHTSCSLTSLWVVFCADVCACRQLVLAESKAVGVVEGRARRKGESGSRVHMVW